MGNFKTYDERIKEIGEEERIKQVEELKSNYGRMRKEALMNTAQGAVLGFLGKYVWDSFLAKRAIQCIGSAVLSIAGTVAGTGYLGGNFRLGNEYSMENTRIERKEVGCGEFSNYEEITVFTVHNSKGEKTHYRFKLDRNNGKIKSVKEIGAIVNDLVDRKIKVAGLEYELGNGRPIIEDAKDFK